MNGGWLRRNAVRVGATVFAVFGIFWIFASANQTYFVDTPHVSLSFLPLVSGAILTLLCAVIIVSPLSSELTDDGSAANEADAAPIDGGAMLRVALALVAVLVYGILLPRVHSLLTTFGLMAAGLALAGEPVRPKLFLIAGVAAIALYLIFVLWLGVPLPGGRFF